MAVWWTCLSRGVLFLWCGVWRHPRAKTIREGSAASAMSSRPSAQLRTRPGRQQLPPLRPVLLVLRLDRVPRIGPVVVAPVAELVEIAAHRQRLGAVHGDGLAADPVAAAG